MKILILHNRYRDQGGEEAVVSSEIELLRSNGHKVLFYELSNTDLFKGNIFRKISHLFNIIWSRESYKKVRKIIREEKPDIVHIHNVFFLMSVSVYYACRHENAVVVQSLHNYRFLCPMAVLYRDGRVCRECLDKGLLMSIKNKCIKKSKLWAVAMLCILKFHYKNNTFKKFINTYIALSSFSKEQFALAGFNAERIKIKPNFIDCDPGLAEKRGDYALCISRFSPEKGIDILLEAWKKVDYLPLKVIGDGSQFSELKEYSQKHSLDVEFFGHKPNSEVIDCIKKSLMVVLPSKCNENFPRIIVESFACSTPVIASKIGALAEIVKEGKTGLLFDSEAPDDLADKVKYLYQNREVVKSMGSNARKEYEEKYKAQTNYEMLMNIYRDAIESHKAAAEKDVKRYSLENPFVYEGNYFHDYFRAIPFARSKKMLDKNNMSLDDKTLLVASCGCGIDAHYLKKYYNPRKICFTDIHMRAMEKTKSNFHKESFVLTDNHKLSFKDNAFDYVFVGASLHHLKEPLRGIYELLRVAKEGLIVIEPNDSWLTRAFEKLGWASEYEPDHDNYVYRFSKRDVVKISKALFFKYEVRRFFAVHKVAKTKLEFLIIKAVNAAANIFCPSIGNYIVFLVKKEQILPKCMKNERLKNGYYAGIRKI